MADAQPDCKLLATKSNFQRTYQISALRLRSMIRAVLSATCSLCRFGRTLLIHPATRGFVGLTSGTEDTLEAGDGRGGGGSARSAVSMRSASLDAGMSGDERARASIRYAVGCRAAARACTRRPCSTRETGAASATAGVNAGAASRTSIAPSPVMAAAVPLIINAYDRNTVNER